MAIVNSKEKKANKKRGKVFKSFNEWEANFFPELAQEDQLESLKRDTGLVAKRLANDTFERLRVG